jgi:hypothetical protein
LIQAILIQHLRRFYTDRVNIVDKIEIFLAKVWAPPYNTFLATLRCLAVNSPREATIGTAAFDKVKILPRLPTLSKKPVNERPVLVIPYDKRLPDGLLLNNKKPERYFSQIQSPPTPVQASQETGRPSKR